MKVPWSVPRLHWYMVEAAAFFFPRNFLTTSPSIGITGRLWYVRKRFLKAVFPEAARLGSVELTEGTFLSIIP